jgi:uncharacterized protein (TIGR03435 family)
MKKQRCFSLAAAILFTSVVAASAGGLRLFGQSAVRPHFDVASVRARADVTPGVITGDVRVLPGGRLNASEAIPRFLIQNAYAVKSFQIAGGPNWINSAHFTIEAKGADDATPQQVMLMLQSLLEDRFKLKVHRETRELPIFELRVGRGGPKLQASKEGACSTPDPNAANAPLPPPPPPGQLPSPPVPGASALPMCGSIQASAGVAARIDGRRITMADFLRVLSNVMGRTVTDRTGFTSTFDVHLEFSRDQSLTGIQLPDALPSPDQNNGSIFTAVQEQLGLRLESARAPVDVVVIDSIERPTEN